MDIDECKAKIEKLEDEKSEKITPVFVTFLA